MAALFKHINPHACDSITPPTKLELVAYHLLEQELNGVSALSGLAALHDLNLRNGVSDLRAVGVGIKDEYFRHHHSGGGVVYMKRYWLSSFTDVVKLVAIVNVKRAKRGAVPISPEQVARYLRPYENAPTEAEA